MQKQFLALFAALCLTACAVPSQGPVSSGAATKTVAIPEYVYDFALALSVAEQIAKKCRRLAFSRENFKADEVAIKERLEADGVTKAEQRLFSRNIPEKRVQDELLAYIAKRGIVITQRETFCVAGRAEIAEGTSIGRYLRDRG